MAIALYGPVDISSGSTTLACVMPSPQEENDYQLGYDVKHYRSLSGVHYTYRTKPTDQKLHYRFISLAKEKARELGDMFKLYHGQELYLLDFLGRVYIVKFGTADLVFTSTGADSCGEYGEMALELVGKRIA